MNNKGFTIELYNSQNATQTFIADITRLCKSVQATIRLNNVSDLSFSIEIEAWKEFCNDSGIDPATAFKPLASEIKVKYNGVYYITRIDAGSFSGTLPTSSEKLPTRLICLR